MEKISALILAKNEERNIEDCIKTVQFCDEVLVIDDFSTDRTKELAEGLGARVIQRSMNGDWGGQQIGGPGGRDQRNRGQRRAERLLDPAGKPVSL